jgi:transposase InsO family protein
MLKTENPAWGARRIKDELRRLGIKVSEPTIQKVLREAGFAPRPGHPFKLERYRSAAKDVMWALDFFVVRTAKGVCLNVLLIIDVHTRELIDLRSAEVWGPTSVWTVRTLFDAMRREHRQPKIIITDHGTQFYGQFERQLAVLDIERVQIGPCHAASCRTGSGAGVERWSRWRA